MTNTRTVRSAYMHWVKTETHAAFNLANSGLKNYPLSELPVDFTSLTLSGPGAYGYTPLVEAIARKCQVDPSCVATAQGTSMANHLAMAAILEPGDEVLIERPAYPLLWETASYLGAQVKFFERDPHKAFAVDLASLQSLVTPVTRLIVLTNLHNPSCAVLTRETLLEIAAIARSVHARVLVDEVYLDLLDPAPPTAFHLGPGFVITNSLTKVYGLSGLRCGWILAEPNLIRRIYRLNDLFGVNNPYVTDQLSCAALAHLPHIAAWSRELLTRNRAIANDFLAATPGLTSEPLEAGTVLFPRVDVPVPDLCDLLRRQYDTVITPGAFFDSPDRVRIAIGGDTATLSAGLNRVHDALRTLHSGSESS